jgi:hypothetical protein
VFPLFFCDVLCVFFFFFVGKVDFKMLSVVAFYFFFTTWGAVAFQEDLWSQVLDNYKSDPTRPVLVCDPSLPRHTKEIVSFLRPHKDFVCLQSSMRPWWNFFKEEFGLSDYRKPNNKHTTKDTTRAQQPSVSGNFKLNTECIVLKFVSSSFDMLIEIVFSNVQRQFGLNRMMLLLEGRWRLRAGTSGRR